jgi:uncharacterized protein YdeI (YjbR/CyaY-like superfamily)
MYPRDKRIDVYIFKSASFAQPVLIHLRELIHKVCPQVEEKIKWSFPHFDYKGEMMIHLAAFKHHCAFGFWKAGLMQDEKNILQKGERDAMGNLGKIKDLKDLPSDVKLKKLIREAMRLNEQGIKLPPRKLPSAAETKAPAWIMKEIKKDKTIQQRWLTLSPGRKKEYIQWLTDAKTESTRLKRMYLALDWIAEGKSRNWKYEGKHKNSAKI